MKAVELLEQDLRKGRITQGCKFIIWAYPCYYSEHKVNREGGYLAIDDPSGGCPYVSQFGGGTKFFDTFQSANDFAEKQKDFLVSGYEVHLIPVTVFRT